jgi:hypothetical protein
MRLVDSRFSRALSSPRFAVICLAWLFLLVLAGTLYQANHSSYDAQQLFFHAWIAWAGPVPLPAGQLTLAVLGINLLWSLATRIRWIITNAGLLVLHAGLILLLLSGLLSRIGTQSTAVSLVQGQDYSVSLDPIHWDFYVQSDQGLVSIPLSDLKRGKVLQSPINGLYLEIREIYPNSTMTEVGSTGEAVPRAVPPEADPAADLPAIVVDITDGTRAPQTGSLFGGDQVRTRVTAAGRSFAMWLAHSAYPLPARLRLIDFQADFYPGSDVPKSFASTVLLGDGDTSREAVISMNRPLRYRGYTFYQSAYGMDPQGERYSVLEVVKNPGRVLPYLSSFVILAGLAVHALLRRGGAK